MNHHQHDHIEAIPLAVKVLYNTGIVLSPAVGALLMSMSTVIVAFNARLLKKSGKKTDCITQIT